MGYRICPDCGARLDPGEICDCWKPVQNEKCAKRITWPGRKLNDSLWTETGDLILIGGDCSESHKAMAIQCAYHWGQNVNVGVFATETRVDRLSVIASGKVNIEFIGAYGYNLEKIRAITERRGYQVVLIEEVRLLNALDDLQYDQVAIISEALLQMAQEMQVMIVVLLQFGRESSIAYRDFVQLAQTASVVMIHSGRRNNGVLHIEKNKDGRCGSIPFSLNSVASDSKGGVTDG